MSSLLKKLKAIGSKSDIKQVKTPGKETVKIIPEEINNKIEIIKKPETKVQENKNSNEKAAIEVIKSDIVTTTLTRPKTAALKTPSTNEIKKVKYGLDDFNFFRTLGTGSFGRVHLVRLKTTQVYYAIKVSILTKGFEKIGNYSNETN